MLYRVRIENFYSVGPPQEIDLRVRKSVEDRLGRLSPIYSGSEIRAPNVTVLFGPNAAGKSTILKAIMFGVEFVTESFRHGPNQGFRYLKFQNVERLTQPTRLSYSFSGPANFLDLSGEGPQCPYTYEISLSPRSDEPDFVMLERLSHQPRGSGKPLTIIERRDDGSLRHSRNFMNGAQKRALKAALRPNASAISTLAGLNHELAKSFIERLNVSTNLSLSKKVDLDENLVTRWYANNRSAFDRLQTVSRTIDLGIEGITMDDLTPEPHMQFRQSGLDIGIPFHFESHGTQQFIKMFSMDSHSIGEWRHGYHGRHRCIHPSVDAIRDI